MGWDTRFADATGQYSLNQVAGESYCSELDTGANGTKYNCTEYNPTWNFTNPSGSVEVHGDSSWKLPYLGQLWNSMVVDYETGFVMNQTSSLNFELSMAVTPYRQLASQTPAYL